MELVAKGFSLARFGDGEMKMAEGFGYAREPGGPKLAAELMRTLRTPHVRCLVGVPTFDPEGPKYNNWLRHKPRFETLLQPKHPYYSAFVSRPDSAPWINCPEYGQLVESIWRDKLAVVVCEKSGSMLQTVKLGADWVTHVACPHREAYAEIDRIEDKVRAAKPDVVIMAAGPTATCLANRLAADYIHAVDLGSAGGFLGRLLK